MSEGGGKRTSGERAEGGGGAGNERAVSSIGRSLCESHSMQAVVWIYV